MASRKQYDKAAELGKRIEAKEAELKEAHRRLGARARLAAPKSSRACRADRLAPDRHSGQRADGGRTRSCCIWNSGCTSAWWARTKRCARWPMPVVVARGAAREGGQAGGDFSCSSGRPAWVRPSSPLRWESIYGDEGALPRIDMSEYGNAIPWHALVGALRVMWAMTRAASSPRRCVASPTACCCCWTRSRSSPRRLQHPAAGVRRRRLTDGKGRVVDFTNTIIIATLELGLGHHPASAEGPLAPARKYEDQVRGDGRAAWTLPARVHQPYRRGSSSSMRWARSDPPYRRPAARSWPQRRQPGRDADLHQTLIDHFAEEGYKPEFGA